MGNSINNKAQTPFKQGVIILLEWTVNELMNVMVIIGTAFSLFDLFHDIYFTMLKSLEKINK